MKPLPAALLALTLLCSFTGKPTKKKQVPAQDTTPKVTGVGGIFFYSDNPKETRAWYRENLGMEVNDYGATFESENSAGQSEVLQWTPFKKGSSYFAPSKKEFMINYRVQHIEGLLRKLSANGVTILDSLDNTDYGKFVHIMDAEGNKIELWEPNAKQAK